VPTPPPAPASYVAKAVHFDGSTYLVSADSLGAVNGPRGILSFFSKQAHSGDLATNPSNTPAVGQGFLYSGGNNFSGWQFGVNLYPGPSQPNSFGWYMNDVSSNGLNEDTNNILSVGAWDHFLFSWNSLTTALYKNDVLVSDHALSLKTGTPPIEYLYNDVYGGVGWVIGSFFAGSNSAIIGDISEIYFNTVDTIVQNDATILEADRRKFSTADNKPVDLGGDGSTPTGHAPTIFLTGDASEWPNNAAGTGSFTTTGTLTDAPTSPSN
jgi:hypothetical protein